MSIEKPTSEQALEREHTPEASHERSHEDRHEHRETNTERQQSSEEARHDALEIASPIEEVKHPHQETSPAERRGPITKKQLDREFKTTMQAVQEEMSPTKRGFSKMIHAPLVEKTSEFLASTIARPNALLAGSVGAFILTLGIYLFAKSVGYPLSGFEPIAAFIIGWIAGMAYDYFRIMVTGKK